MEQLPLGISLVSDDRLDLEIGDEVVIVGGTLAHRCGRLTEVQRDYHGGAVVRTWVEVDGTSYLVRPDYLAAGRLPQTPA